MTFYTEKHNRNWVQDKTGIPRLLNLTLEIFCKFTCIMKIYIKKKLIYYVNVHYLHCHWVLLPTLVTLPSFGCSYWIYSFLKIYSFIANPFCVCDFISNLLTETEISETLIFSQLASVSTTVLVIMIWYYVTFPKNSV